ncbi:hypothetical protein [Romboutsia lituseburensis]|nr:hypothetical protein [Romboutsia lituseburensis]MCR8747161.1 hypothetical protein [Romboutsia lituseburensis]
MNSNFKKILIVCVIVIFFAILEFCYTHKPSELPRFLLKWMYT